MKAIVIIPAYNESKNILAVINSITAAGYDYLVINDGSSDSTVSICDEHHINYLNLSRNLGIGGAVQAGHRYAFENDYDVDIQFDGDGQHDAAFIPALISQIENGDDLVIGSRFIEPSEGFRSTAMRRLGIRWLSHFIHLFSGLTITDATSGFRACDRKTIELFCDYYPSDYPEPESIVYAHNAGMTVSEVPVLMHERQGGTSSISGASGAYYMLKVSLAISILGIARKRRF